MKLVIAFIFTIICCGAFAQRGLIHYTREDGLVSNDIRGIAYDNKGFIWLATSKGIDRFDGKRFISFKHVPSEKKTIPSNDIQQLHFDGKKYMWAVTYNKGLIRINTSDLTHQLFNLSNSQISNSINCIYSNQDSIWIANYSNQLFLFTPKNGKIVNFNISNKVSHSESLVYFIKQDKVIRNQLCIGTSDGIVLLNVATKKIKHFTFRNETSFYGLKNSNHPNQFYSMIQMSKGNMLIGTSNGALLYFDQYQGLFKKMDQTIDAFKESEVSSIEWLDSRFAYLCMKGKGLCLFDTWNKTFIQFQNEVQTNFSPLNVTRFNTQITISTSNAGFFTQDNSLIYGKGVQLPFPYFSIQLIDNQKFILEKNHEYQLRNLTTNSIVTLPTILNPIYFGITKNHRAIIVDSHQILSIEKNGKKNIKKVSFSIKSAKIFQDSLLAIATSDFKLVVFRISDFSFQESIAIPNQSKKYNLSADFNPIFCEQNNQLYISSYDKLLLYTPNTKKLLSIPIFNHEDSDLITALTVKGNNFLIGTKANGVWEYQPNNQFSTCIYNENSGFFAGEIKQLATDSKKRLWILTTTGTAVLSNTNKLINFLDAQNGLENIRSISLNNQYLYFQKESGYVLSSINTLLPPKQQANPYLLRIYLPKESKQVHLTKRNFKYNENSFLFEYGIRDFTINDAKSISYRLVGLDNKWKSGNLKNEVIYYNLSPGLYSFELKVENQQNSKIFKYPFYIETPFWKSVWFYVIITLLLVFGIWLFMRHRINRIKKEEQLKATFNAKISQLESKALRAQMNPHFLFNSLNSIRLFILKNEVDTAADYMAMFSKLLRMILNHSRQDLIPVYDEIQSLKLYLEFERLRFGQDFDFDLQIDGQQVLDFQIPPMIIQPFIENAIWHGLMPKKDGLGKIRVSFQKQQSGLYILVEDNGIGRDVAKQHNRKRSLKEGSVGLQITKERLESLSMLSNRQNYFEIEDLFDQNEKPIGTLVTLYFENIN